MSIVEGILTVALPVLVIGFIVLLLVRLVNAVERIADKLDKR